MPIGWWVSGSASTCSSARGSPGRRPAPALEPGTGRAAGGDPPGCPQPATPMGTRSVGMPGGGGRTGHVTVPSRGRGRRWQHWQHQQHDPTPVSAFRRRCCPRDGFSDRELGDLQFSARWRRVPRVCVLLVVVAPGAASRSSPPGGEPRRAGGRAAAAGRAGRQIDVLNSDLAEITAAPRPSAATWTPSGRAEARSAPLTRPRPTPTPPGPRRRQKAGRDRHLQDQQGSSLVDAYIRRAPTRTASTPCPAPVPPKWPSGGPLWTSPATWQRDVADLLQVARGPRADARPAPRRSPADRRHRRDRQHSRLRTSRDEAAGPPATGRRSASTPIRAADDELALEEFGAVRRTAGTTARRACRQAVPGPGRQRHYVPGSGTARSSSAASPWRPTAPARSAALNAR